MTREISREGRREAFLAQEELFAKVCQRLPRNLTHAEWNRYFGPDEPYHPTCPNLPVPTE